MAKITNVCGGGWLELAFTKASSAGWTVLSAVLLVAACRGGSLLDTAEHTATVVSSARPAHLTTRDVATLRWIEGTWRGSGGGEKPFYERYVFVDDSTLRVDSFADSTLAVVSDTTFFALRDCRLWAT